MMCRKLVFLISSVVVLALAGQAAGQANIGWDGGEPDSNNWLDPCNWAGDIVPGPIDTADIVDGSITINDNFGEANMPVIYPGDNVQVGMLVVSTNTNFMPLGTEDQAFPAYLTVQGNLAVLGESIFIGSWWAAHIGVLNIELGGTITNVGNPGRTWVGYRCRGEVYMTGGSWTLNQLELARGDDCYDMDPEEGQRGAAIVRLEGGTITVNEFFTMRMGYPDCGAAGAVSWPDSNGHMSVSGDGTLIINGDATAQLQQYGADGWITAYGEPWDPCNPFDTNIWYQPGTDPNNFWMPKRASLLIDYDIRNTGKTTLTAVLPSRGEARTFNPPYGAQGVGLTPMLSWSPGDYVAYGGEYLGTANAKKGNGHHVFFHTDKSWVDTANLNYPTGTAYGHIVGANDLNYIDIAPHMPGGKLKLDTTYHWMVIEVNDANATANPWFWKSTTHSFRTVGGGPANPNPGNGAVLDYYLGDSLETDLSWSRGFYAADVNGHDVYFGTDLDEVNDANLSYDPAGTYQGRQSVQTSHVSNLLLGQTYYWRVDEVNLAGPDPCMWKGETWSFTVAPYRIVEDFSSYASSAELQDAWQTNLYSSCAPSADGGTVYLDRGAMEFVYDNNDDYYGSNWFSEARYTYAAPADWTEGDVTQDAKALQISLTGFAGNDDDPNYDRIYIAVEDDSDNIAVVYHDDPSVQTNTDTQQWDIDFREFTDAGVVLNVVKYVYIGSGVRCNPSYQGTGGDGTVWFDDMHVYIPRCLGTPGYRQLGDLNGDCTVDRQDVKTMSNDWLAADELATATDPGTDGLVVHYTFDGAAGSTITDSSLNSYNGTSMYNYSDPNFVDPNLRDCNEANALDPERVCCPTCPNYEPDNPYCAPGAPNEPNIYGTLVDAAYDPCGVLGGCIDFTAVFDGPNEVNYGVSIPNDVFSQIGNKMTISLWINAPENPVMDLLWCNLFNTDAGINAYCPTPGPPTFPFPDSVHWTVGTPTPDTYDTTLDWGDPGPEYFIGWNHFVFVHDADANFAAVYYDGDKVDDASRKEDFNYVQIEDANDFWLCATATGSGGWWKGKIDDFRIYNRVLTHGEIVYLAGYPLKYYPLASLANIYGNDEDGMEPQGQRWVNFKDVAVLADDWMKSDLWPLGTSP